LGTQSATIEQHPLPKLLRHGIPVVLSTDDPAMFHTTLVVEYENAACMGLNEPELLHLARMSFDHSFLSDPEKRRLVNSLRQHRSSA
jgi:adenosine deaminase